MAKRAEDDTDFNLSSNISPHYEKFFNKFSEIEQLEVIQWNTVHLLGYLCKRYKEYYNIEYTFSFNNPAPSKSYEIFNIKKIANMLSSNPKIIKEYIDWVFTTKIMERKRRVTSLGYFAHPDIINEYKFKYLLVNKVPSRADSLPTPVLAICAANGLNISTYGELAFASKSAGSAKLLSELRQTDFKLDVLDKIA